MNLYFDYLIKIKKVDFVKRGFLLWRSIVMNDGKSRALPVKLQVEVSRICNLKCPMCIIGHSERNKLPKVKTMSFPFFKNIIDLFNPLMLTLTGIGESFLNKDIFQMIAYAKSKNIFVKMDTNGLLLKNVLEQIVTSNLDILSFSIDTIVSNHYKQLRPSGDVGLLIDNIKNLKIIRDKVNSNLELRAFFLLSTINYQDIEGIIRYALETGFDKFDIGIALPFLSDLEDDSLYIDNTKDKELQRDILHNLDKGILFIRRFLTRTNKKRYFNVLASLIDHKLRLKEKFSNNKPWRRPVTYSCFTPYYAPAISVDGDILPCCSSLMMFYDKKEPHQYSFGKIGNETFIKNINPLDLINSKDNRTLKVNIINNKSNLCRDCQVNESFISKFTRPFRRSKKLNI